VPDSESNKDQLSRLDQFHEHHIHRILPPVEDGDYLLEMLNRCGMVSQGAGGIASISWQEIKAFKELSGEEIDWWEADVLMSLSRAYVSMYHRASDAHMPPPYETDDEELIQQHRKEETRLIKQRLRGSAKEKAPN